MRDVADEHDQLVQIVLHLDIADRGVGARYDGHCIRLAHGHRPVGKASFESRYEVIEDHAVPLSQVTQPGCLGNRQSTRNTSAISRSVLAVSYFDSQQNDIPDRSAVFLNRSS